MAARLERVASLVGHVDTCVWHVAWSPAGVLASCGTDKTIRLWVEADASGEWQGVAVLEEAHQRTIRCVAWSPCGSFLASCSFDGTAMVWEVQGTEFDCVASLEGHENEVKAVAWSRSGQYLATCGRDKSVWVWEGEDEQYEVAAVIHSHTQDVKSIAWHPQQDVLGSASYDDSVKLFAPHGDDWRCAATLRAHASTVWALAFSADGSGLVTCSDDRAVVLWRDTSRDGGGGGGGGGDGGGGDGGGGGGGDGGGDGGGGGGGGGGGDGTPQYEEVARLEGAHSRAIYTVSWGAGAAGDDLIATGGADDAVCLLRASLGGGAGADAGPAAALRLLSTTPAAHAADVNCVAWRPMVLPAPCLATAGDDGRVCLWRPVS